MKANIEEGVGQSVLLSQIQGRSVEMGIAHELGPSYDKQAVFGPRKKVHPPKFCKDLVLLKNPNASIGNWMDVRLPDID